MSRAHGAAMLRIAVVLLVAFAGVANAEEPCACDVTAAACDTACACDLECEVDWTKDECAEPGAGCLPPMTDAQVEAAELADAAREPIEWTADAHAVACPEGSSNVDGTCVVESLEVAGGCDASGATGLLLVF